MVSLQNDGPVVNAVIRKATISREEGFLTAVLELDYGGVHQGFGVFALYLPKSFDETHQLRSFAGHYMWRVMEIADVTSWDMVVGRSVRVLRENGLARAIGHIVRNAWFRPSEELKDS